MQDRTGLSRLPAALAPLFAACVGSIDAPGMGPAGGGADDQGPISFPAEQPGNPAAPAAYKPGRSGLRQLRPDELVASMQDLLLGPVTLTDLERPVQSYGLSAVGASRWALSGKAVSDFEATARAALDRVFRDPARRSGLVGCAPKGIRDDACVGAFLARFVRLAWRGAASSPDLAGHVTLAGQVAEDQGDFYAGLSSAASAVLQSPYFLYRVELGEPVPNRPGWLRYTSLEMASRLSYLLWNTTPDDALLTAGEAGDLVDLGRLRSQAERLLTAGRSREGLGGFVDDFLGLYGLPAATKDPKLFPQLTATLRRAMATEVRLLFEKAALTTGGDVLELLETPRTFVNPELGKLYGLSVTSDSFVPVTQPAGSVRAGLLGTAAILTLHSRPDATSPTLRGKFVREALLCQSIGAPPAKDSKGNPVAPLTRAGTVTRRQQLDAHMVDPACKGCHTLMDPIGLALENFDAIGVYRKTDKGIPIDPSGQIDGLSFADAVELGHRLHDHPDAARCLIQKIYRYATGRGDLTGEQPLIDELERRLRASGNDFRKLILEIVASDGFRFAGSPS